jgi:polyhydroxybutyrate depolymerase
MRTRLLPLMVLVPLACGDQAGGEATTAATSSGTAAGSSSGGPPADPTTSAAGSTSASADDDDTNTPATTGGPDDSSGGEATSETTGTPAACPESPLPAGDHLLEVPHSTGLRTALLHVPPGLDPNTPAPLIFNFHGFTMTGAGEQAFSRMDMLSDAEGVIVVYPDGLANSWNAGACCGDSATKGVDDVGFVRALHAHLATQVCYDPRRVYSTGMSNGGFLTNRLACEAADLFAAFGPVSSVNGMETCEPSRPVPVIAFNGTDDILVAYDGLLYISVPESFAAWGARNGCVGEPEPGKVNGDGHCATFTDCADGVQVTQCTLEGMGHCWPGNPACLYGTPGTDLDANAEMWAFFSQYSLP